MFEKAQPQPIGADARFEGHSDGLVSRGDAMVGRAVWLPESPGRGGSALRMIEWSELTTRLNAARDLRLLLRRDSHGIIESGGGSFADAAARYFRTLEEGERDVNPVALEHGKSSSGMFPEAEGVPRQALRNRGQDATGDTRED